MHLSQQIWVVLLPGGRESDPNKHLRRLQGPPPRKPEKADQESQHKHTQFLERFLNKNCLISWRYLGKRSAEEQLHYLRDGDLLHYCEWVEEKVQSKLTPLNLEEDI